VRLLDFGYCKESKICFDCDKSGTRQYSGPELLRRGVYNPQKADIWSLGILLFVMSTGKLPFRSYDDNVIIDSIRRGEFITLPDLDANIAKLYQQMTQLSPNRRPTVHEILLSGQFEGQSIVARRQISHRRP
jgi:serine/threonine protein kinase